MSEWVIGERVVSDGSFTHKIKIDGESGVDAGWEETGEAGRWEAVGGEGRRGRKARWS